MTKYIFKGKVVSNTDFTRTGTVNAEVRETYNTYPNYLPVKYVSPHYAPRKGGQFTPPAEQAEILIYIDPENTTKGYYLGTIVADDHYYGEKMETGEESDIDAASLYESIAPASFHYKGLGGDGLEIVSRKSKTRFVDRVKLNSGKMEVLLDSSPESDGVLIKNGNGDYIKINNLAESSLGIPLFIEQSIEIMAHGGVYIDSDAGQIVMSLNEGGDITIENTSTGMMSLTPPYAPHTGNINLFSANKNIHLAAAAGIAVPIEGPNSGGKIILDTNSSEIRVEREAVTIRMNPIGSQSPSITVTKKGIFIDGGLLPLGAGTITINGVNLNINATDSINMQAPTITMVARESVNITSPAQVNVDGTTAINLNSGQSLAAATAASTEIAAALVPIPPVNITPHEYPLKTRYF